MAETHRSATLVAEGEQGVAVWVCDWCCSWERCQEDALVVTRMTLAEAFHHSAPHRSYRLAPRATGRREMSEGRRSYQCALNELTWMLATEHISTVLRGMSQING